MPLKYIRVITPFIFFYEYSEVNDLVYRWFLDATARLFPVSGPLIQEKARTFARDLGFDNFKGSNGWLESFLKRNNIVFKTQSGERGEVKRHTVSQWKESIPSLCEGYAPQDIFNIDETGLFYKDSTKSTFFQKGETCAGGKRSKERITVALCASMTGEKLKPVVIGKSQKPRCFGSISIESLPVTYYSNKKAWMMTNIMVDWLKSVDRKMRAQNRHILLFLDNAPVHPDIKLSNIKLKFFPPNTTSLLQPMDAGIIQAMKLKYRKRQMQHVLVQMDKHSAKTGPQVLRDINVLDAIYWIAGSWRETKEETISKCFSKCGFGVEKEGPQFSDSFDEDCDLDDEIPLSVLKMAQDLFGCDMPELIKIDQNFSTCNNDMTDWDRPANEILKDFDQVSEGTCASDDEDDSEIPEAVSSVEASDCLVRLKHFALTSRQNEMLELLMKAEDMFMKHRAEVNVTQTKISDFFK